MLRLRPGLLRPEHAVELEEYMRQAAKQSLRERRTIRAPIEHSLGGRRVRQRIVDLGDRRSKRVVDVLFAAILLLFLLPVLAIVALVIKIESPGPVFYRCTRVGMDFRPLRMLKFRKMMNGAGGLALTSTNDPRFTRCGRLLAATKLDELPQLWNVLKGEMSLVGPRPEDPEFVAMHRSEYATILSAKPGMTGLSQLAFAREAAILDSQDRVAGYVDRLLPAKVRIDLLYVRRRDLVMDIRILAWTALAVLLRLDVAVDRRSGRLSLRRRPETRGEEQAAPDLGVRRGQALVRLGIFLAVAVIAGAYASIARADASAHAAARAQEAVTTAAAEPAAAERAHQGAPPGQSAGHPTKPAVPASAPGGDGVGVSPSTPPAGETSQDHVDTTEPTSVSESVSPEVEPTAEPISEPAPTGDGSRGNSTPAAGSEAHVSNKGLSDEASPYSSAPLVGVHVAHLSHEQGSKPAMHSARDPGLLPPLPQPTTPAGATGAAAASAGVGASALAALIALFALVPLSLSGILGLRVTSLRSPMLVADVQRPG